MPKSALYSLAAAALILCALAVNQAFARLQPAPMRIAPIERLPRQIAGWSSVDLPIDPKVSAIIPNARFLSRGYREAAGDAAELLLQTSADAESYHSPTVCMPGQGWNIVRTLPTRIEPGGVPATEMWMELGDRRLVMLYWYTSERQLDKWQTLKDRLLAGRPPTRMFVRIIAPVRLSFDAASRTAHRFGSVVAPQVAALDRAD